MDFLKDLLKKTLINFLKELNNAEQNNLISRATDLEINELEFTNIKQDLLRLNIRNIYNNNGNNYNVPLSKNQMKTIDDFTVNNYTKVVNNKIICDYIEENSVDLEIILIENGLANLVNILELIDNNLNSYNKLNKKSENEKKTINILNDVKKLCLYIFKQFTILTLTESTLDKNESIIIEKFDSDYKDSIIYEFYRDWETIYLDKKNKKYLAISTLDKSLEQNENYEKTPYKRSRYFRLRNAKYIQSDNLLINLSFEQLENFNNIINDAISKLQDLFGIDKENYDSDDQVEQNIDLIKESINEKNRSLKENLKFSEDYAIIMGTLRIFSLSLSIIPTFINIVDELNNNDISE
jgi:hypothetical protein